MFLRNEICTERFCCWYFNNKQGGSMIKVGDRFETIRGEEYMVIEYLSYDK